MTTGYMNKSIDQHNEHETLNSSSTLKDNHPQHDPINTTTTTTTTHQQQEGEKQHTSSSSSIFSKPLSSSTSSTSLREIKQKANQKLVKIRDRAIPITRKQKRSRYMPGKRYMPLLWIQWLWHPISLLLGNITGRRHKFHHHHHENHHHHHHHEHHRHDEGNRSGNHHHGLVTKNDGHHDDDVLLMD
eukprot:CAMPEP_0176478946 /NCGR_PEP_ID=MMETSP0200_2-20121128/1467_1 /TAXON_ID=947934 /ORGANISM="Chaetoceros sp., Strain GSL56" /LENGTH=186 /DNA_ID=CAMNT_0017874937 /DNA_START=308 /DNA_END=868 /DNA_ORIENTATION=-